MLRLQRGKASESFSYLWAGWEDSALRASSWASNQAC